MNYSKTKEKKKDLATKDQEGDSTKKEQPEDTSSSPIILLAPPRDDSPRLRMLGLFGTLDEEKVTDLVQGLFALQEYGVEEIYEDPEDPHSPIKES